MTDEGFEAAARPLSCLRDLRVTKSYSHWFKGGTPFQKGFRNLTTLERLELEDDSKYTDKIMLANFSEEG